MRASRHVARLALRRVRSPCCPQTLARLSGWRCCTCSAVTRTAVLLVWRTGTRGVGQPEPGPVRKAALSDSSFFRPSSSNARPAPHVLRLPCSQAGATGAREQATTATPAPAAAAAAAPPPPPPPPDVVTVTVDGKQVSVPRNISVLQVCGLSPRRARRPEPRRCGGQEWSVALTEKLLKRACTQRPGGALTPPFCHLVRRARLRAWTCPGSATTAG